MNRRTFLLMAGAAMGAPTLRAAGTSPRRIGQIGTAHAHAGGKMMALRSLAADWDIAGIVEPDTRRRESIASSRAFQGIPLLTEDVLLAMPDVEAVAVETDMRESCATALRAIRAGKHVHLDKPGALEHGEYKSMRSEAKQRGLTVQMGYMLRYNPAFELLFRAVREGWLGEVTEVDAVMGKLGSATDRAIIQALPGGGMFELGCHMIDAIVTLIGKPRAVHAFSTPTRSDGVKDNQVALLEYPRAVASVRINFADPFGGPRRRFNVTGTAGTFEIHPLESGSVKLLLKTARGSYKQGAQTIQLERTGGRYDGEFIDLAKIVRGEKRLAWTMEHDIAVHETVLRASGVWAPTEN